MQCVGNKAIVFCIFQAYNRLSMHQVIFIVVRSSDRGDSVEKKIRFLIFCIRKQLTKKYTYNLVS